MKKIILGLVLFQTLVNAAEVKTSKSVSEIKEVVTSRSILGQADQVNLEVKKVNLLPSNGSSNCATCTQNSPGQSGGLPDSTLEIATALTAGGDINARVRCSYKADKGMTLAGSIELEIINNKVKYINATVNGCVINLTKFKQIYFPNNKNIVLEDINGCGISIYELKHKGSGPPVLYFGMSPTYDCVKSCAKIEKAHWQIEMNPHSQTCY